MSMSPTTIYSLAQVAIILRQLRADYASSADYCAKNNKPNGVTFNSGRVTTIDEAIKLVEQAITSK